ncbi:MAG TPA: hypothetical protein ENK26_01835 [Gammaproteobacteria bacterium]|nr:hypothetical protein [Gammaproteobacteria bacterium]
MRITAESATGLNELPDEAHASRRDKIAAWRDWLAIQVRHGRRAIISCRTADYIQELDAVGDREVPHLELQTLDLPKIREFLHKRSGSMPGRPTKRFAASRRTTSNACTKPP